MFADFLSHNILYLVSLLAFLAIVAWVYRPSARKRYEANGNIPFAKTYDTRPTRVERP